MPITLVLNVFKAVPDAIHKCFEIRVLADSSFEYTDFLDEVRKFDFEFVVDVRVNRCIIHTGVVTVADCLNGGYIEFQN